VCACNGHNYPSACDAARAGADVAAPGCDGYPTFACGPAAACEVFDQYCLVTTLGEGRARYACGPLPSGCTFSFETGPTCAECFPDAGASCDDTGRVLIVTQPAP
jgi:hypothetical protein